MVTKGSVLVVDDEVNLCRILGAKLAKSGYTVVAVHDGLQAVEKVRESDFDVVLLDLILPKMDGLTALAKIRSTRPELPVIVMTAIENAEALEQAKSYGVCAYVNKPFDLDNLVELVQGTSRSEQPNNGGRLPQSTVLFQKDQPVSLEIQNGTGMKVYPSRITYKDDNTVWVAVPRVNDRIVQVAPNTSVRVGLPAKDAYYSFTSQVVRVKNGGENVLVLEKPSVIYRRQRRHNKRVSVSFPVRFTAYGRADTDPEDICEGEASNLSLGGACILVREEVLPGEMLQLEFLTGAPVATVSTVAQVLHSRPVDVGGENRYALGCRFTYVDEAVSKLIES